MANTIPSPRRASQPITPGTKLHDRIILMGYRLHEVATGTGIDRWRLNDYLNERVPIPPHALYKLARFLDCTPEALQ